MERGEKAVLPEIIIKQTLYLFIVNANLKLDVKGQGWNPNYKFDC